MPSGFSSCAVAGPPPRWRRALLMLKILLADDHDVVRRGLRDLLTQHNGWQICGEATTGREAVAMAINLRPNVAILDLTMPQLNGLEATRQITMHESEQLIREVLAAGARGYLLKSDASRYVIAAVETLAQHRPFFTWKASETMLENFLAYTPAHEGETPRDSLTAREREIVQLLAEGNSSKKIAHILNISIKTVDTHRATIMRKLEAHSIVDIVHYAIRNNLVQP
jgi:DNA-binding NarL/FixJ family response regulator